MMRLSTAAMFILAAVACPLAAQGPSSPKDVRVGRSYFLNKRAYPKCPKQHVCLQPLYSVVLTVRPLHGNLDPDVMSACEIYLHTDMVNKDGRIVPVEQTILRCKKGDWLVDGLDFVENEQ